MYTAVQYFKKIKNKLKLFYLFYPVFFLYLSYLLINFSFDCINFSKLNKSHDLFKLITITQFKKRPHKYNITILYVCNKFLVNIDILYIDILITNYLSYR